MTFIHVHIIHTDMVKSLYFHALSEINMTAVATY